MTKKARVSSSADPTPVPEAQDPTVAAGKPPVRLALAPPLTGVKLATLRDIWFYSDDRVSADGQKIQGNGFAPAFLKLGRAVYVDVATFHAIWRSKQQKSAGGRDE